MNFGYQEIKRLYFQALGLAGEERTRFLDGLDPAARAQVAELLKDDVHDDGFLAPIQGNIKEQMPSIPTVDPMVGRQIGPYKLERQIASGGMGAVYLASRKGDYKQLAAIKLIRSDAATNQEIVKRFQNERQYLASLKHPGIAALLDGGTTEDGLPYFVMEYVDGRPITKYCDEKKLSVTERLKLFQRVCKAVQYCHQRGVIHRDLKPDNILITREGDPKLVDFGIAKVTNVESSFLTSPTPTSPLYRFMTIEYASPEQVKGEVVSTLSDVYSLGVILYELLTGRRPLDIPRRVQSEIERIVSEEQPRNPSDVVTEPIKINKEDATQSKTDPTTTATLRDSAPDSLRRELQGDLDTIVLMALKKDSERRYKSVEEFANDIQRYFDSQPVIARPDSTAYRVRKFVARNPLGVAAASIVAVLIVGAFLGVNAAREVALNALDEKGVALTDKDKALTEKSIALHSLEQALKESEARRQEMLEAKKRSRTALQLSCKSALERAQNLCEKGDTRAGLLWFTRSLEMASEDDDDLQWRIRAEMAAWHRSSVSRKDVRVLDDVGANTLPTSSEIFFAIGSDRKLRLINVYSGEEMAGPQFSHSSETGRAVVAISPVAHVSVSGVGTEAFVWSTITRDLIVGPFRHQYPVLAVAISADGKIILTGTGSFEHAKGEACFWNAITGDQLCPPIAHDNPVSSVAISPDGTKAVTATGGLFQTLIATAGFEARLWHVSADTDVSSLAEPLIHSGGINAVAFSPDGKTLLTSSSPSLRTGEVRLWDVLSGDQLGDVAKHQHQVNAVAFSADGKRFLTGSGNIYVSDASVVQGEVRQWDTTKCQPLGNPIPHSSPVVAVDYSTDGNSIVTASWDVERREAELRTWRLSAIDAIGVRSEGFGNIEDVSINARGETVVALVNENSLRIWNSTTQEMISGPMQHSALINTAVFSPGAETIVTGSNDMTAQQWDAKTGRPNGLALQHQHGVRKITVSDDGKLLLTGSGSVDPVTYRVQLWESKSCKAIGTPIDIDGSVGSVLAISPSATSMLAGLTSATGEEPRIVVWDLRTGKRLFSPLPHRFGALMVVGAAYSRNETRLLTAGCSMIDLFGIRIAELQMWDMSTGAPIGDPFQLSEVCSSFTLSPDDKLIAIGTGRWGDDLGGDVRLVDPARWSILGVPMITPKMVKGIKFSSDGAVLLFWTDDGAWSLNAKQLDVDAESASLWFQRTTGMCFDDQGVTTPLDGNRWIEIRDRLDSKIKAGNRE